MKVWAITVKFKLYLMDDEDPFKSVKKSITLPRGSEILSAKEIKAEGEESALY